MQFQEALQKLDIEDYATKIANSNSHGELFYLQDYIIIAETFNDLSWFREWFEQVIKYTKAHWDRPESVFQHIPKMLEETLK